MGSLLVITAFLTGAWGLLFVGGLALLGGDPTNALTVTMARSGGAMALVLAVLFAWASREPRGHLAIVYAAIALMACKILTGLVGLLGTLPPQPSVFYLIDLLASVALLVGLLESLPRLLRGEQRR